MPERVLVLPLGWLAQGVERHPDRVVLRDADRGYSLRWRELEEGVAGAARALRGLGVVPGDRVAVHARNRLETIELFFACASLGAVLVPLNWRLTAPELRAILLDCDPSVLFCDAPGGRAVDGVASGLPRVSLDADGAPGPWWRRERGADGPDAPCHEGTPALILYTSGSTGRPKGAVLTHGNLAWNAVNTVVGWGLGSEDRTLCAAPLFHTGGWNVLTLPLLSCGGVVSFSAAFDPAATLRAVEEGQATVLFGVPTMYQAMVAEPAFATADLRGLRFAVSGGAPCPEALNAAWLGRGVEFKQGYGLTEVGPNCFCLPDGGGAEDPGSVGVPMPHLRLRVVDEDHRAVAPGEVGELQLAGPTVCQGYWRRPDATAAARTPDGWFRSGDLFTVDGRGWYRCVGRSKEMFISGGENVYPAEVERVLCGLPGVAEAAVVPAPDPSWGEVGHAFLSFRGSKVPDEAAIRALCRQRLAGYKVPRWVTVLEALPTGPTGKVDRHRLTALAAAP